MKHRSLDFMHDPHMPNNSEYEIQSALELVLQEMSDDAQFNQGRGVEERLSRIEAGFMLLAGRMSCQGNL